LVKILLSVLAAGLLAACGGTAAPVSTPSPSQAQLAAEYLKLVAPTNVANDHLNAALKITPLDGPNIRAATKDFSDAEATLNTALLAFEKKVPATVQVDIEAARHVLSLDIADMYNVINSTDDASLTTALNAWPNRSSAAFVLVRSDLGLPPPS
jgi:hypothetical protein